MTLDLNSSFVWSELTENEKWEVYVAHLKENPEGYMTLSQFITRMDSLTGVA